jgi:putative DNA primase/helicase
MSAGNQTPGANDAAEIVIDEGNLDLVDAFTAPAANDPKAQDWGNFPGKKLQAPAGDVTPPWPDRPQIVIADGDLPAIVDAAEKVAAQHFYSRGNGLVRVSAARELPDDLKNPLGRKRNGINRADDQRVILGCAPIYIATEITRHADVKKYDARAKGHRKTDFSEKYANALLERKTWPLIRPLDAIVRAPFVREDGSICDQPGYDERSRCFADFDPAEFDELPDEVTKGRATAALNILLQPFLEFPFKNESARSALIAHILTEAARIAVDCSPFFVYSAPEASSGKTLLSKVASTIVHGTEPAVRTWPNSGEELRKLLLSVLLAGDRAILFDNIGVGVKLRSPELCAFATAPVWTDRKLGESKSPALPNKVVVSGTGNNVNPVGDLARRSLVIRLNANMTRRELNRRTFRIPNLPGYLREHRAELLRAALTVIKGHQQSGHAGPTPLPSFEQWSRLVRDALLWLGMPDPVETQHEETDDEASTLNEAFVVLAATLAGPFTPGDVVRLVLLDSDGKLIEALRNGGCSEPRDAQKIGYWLRENRDRLAGGLQLQLVSASASSHSSKRYQLVPLASTERTVDLNADLTGGAA